MLAQLLPESLAEIGVWALLVFVAYLTAAASYRFGLDPDNHGIPIVTATMDFFGVLCLVAAIVIFGVS